MARWRGLRTGVALIVAGAVAGCVVSLLAGAQWRRQSAVAADCGAREWTGVVTADPLAGAFGPSVEARLVGGPLDGAQVRVGWPSPVPVPELGRVVRFSAILEPLSAEETWSRRSARGGTVARGNAWKAAVGPWRPGLAGRLLAWRAGALEVMHAIPGAGGALLEGIVLGDRRRLIGTPTEEDFRTLGLSHLVAVSGSHLALACGAVALVGSAFKLRRRPLVLVTVAAGAAYALVTGMPYSALRSLLMLAIAGAGQLAGRRGDGVASLAVAAVAVLVLDPWAVFDIGFQLSALAVAGLLLFGGLATAWAACAFGERWRALGSVLALTCVAQAGTVAISASTFGMLSVAAPIANAFAAPLVSVALWIGLAGVTVGSLAPAIRAVALDAATAVLAITAWSATWMARLPGAAIVLGTGTAFAVGVAALAGVVWVRWPLPRSRRAASRVVAGVLAGSLALGAGPAPPRPFSLVVLDVGQGDAILVRDSGRAMLVDAGADPTVLRKALARHGLRRADVVVLTHAHDDHTGGLAGLTSVIDVGWIGIPAVGSDGGDPIRGLGAASELRALRTGDAWQVGRTAVTVLWPDPDAGGELATNDTSIVLQLTRGAFDAVLTGDAEGEPQRRMGEAGLLAPVEVLKVPHHGSVNGLTADALAVWSPEVAIISVGHGNDFGHPSPGTLEMLAAAHTAIWRTDRVGDVTVRVLGDGYTVTGERRSRVALLRGTMARERRSAREVTTAGGADGPLRGRRGGQEHRGAQTGLLDLREGRPAARARPPPPP
jgi:competence protein ComEC